MDFPGQPPLLVPRERKSSTSADGTTNPLKLRHWHIGHEVTVWGRDITLGQNQAPVTLFTGQLESMRMTKTRMVLCLLIAIREGRVAQPRIIEILIQEKS